MLLRKDSLNFTELSSVVSVKCWKLLQLALWGFLSAPLTQCRLGFLLPSSPLSCSILMPLSAISPAVSRKGALAIWVQECMWPRRPQPLSELSKNPLHSPGTELGEPLLFQLQWFLASTCELFWGSPILRCPTIPSCFFPLHTHCYHAGLMVVGGWPPQPLDLWVCGHTVSHTFEVRVVCGYLVLLSSCSVFCVRIQRDFKMMLLQSSSRTDQALFLKVYFSPIPQTEPYICYTVSFRAPFSLFWRWARPRHPSLPRAALREAPSQLNSHVYSCRTCSLQRQCILQMFRWTSYLIDGRLQGCGWGGSPLNLVVHLHVANQVLPI